MNKQTTNEKKTKTIQLLYLGANHTPTPQQRLTTYSS